MTKPSETIRHFVRPTTLFAGIREPIQSRDELPARMEEVHAACGDAAIGPMTNIFRFDTPVEGYDSEIGLPVSKPVNRGRVKTHTLRSMSFFSAIHEGPVNTMRETSARIGEHMNQTGLASELELVEIYHQYDPSDESSNRIEILRSFLAWPEVYREQLVRVLGEDAADEIWAGGEAITPFTPVDERAAWVGASLERLKTRTDQDQQFDILSRVALVNPAENTAKYREIYLASGNSVQAVIDAQNAHLSTTPTGGWIDPPYTDGVILHVSKVARNREAYDVATSPDERRRAYCFCTLVSQANDPKIDPIFCYRAAGWARQFWEPILGVDFTRCDITHSILKGDDFCAWNYHLP